MENLLAICDRHRHYDEHVRAGAPVFRSRNRHRHHLCDSLLFLLREKHLDGDARKLIEPKGGQSQDEGGGQKAKAELVERGVAVFGPDVAKRDVHGEDPPGHEDDA